jgi:hypothetical protein
LAVADAVPPAVESEEAVEDGDSRSPPSSNTKMGGITSCSPMVSTTLDVVETLVLDILWLFFPKLGLVL